MAASIAEKSLVSCVSKPDPANPRHHSKKQVRQVAESIKAFGFNVPILVDRDGNIIADHGRWLACRGLGFTEVPILCLDHLTPAQARAFMIADNRLTEIAVWDDPRTQATYGAAARTRTRSHRLQYLLR